MKKESLRKVALLTMQKARFYPSKFIDKYDKLIKRGR